MFQIESDLAISGFKSILKTQVFLKTSLSLAKLQSDCGVGGRNRGGYEMVQRCPHVCGDVEMFYKRVFSAGKAKQKGLIGNCL